jgi:pyruvate-formate lyase-activating enzyme
VFSAVHSDRSGRIVLAADYGAAMFDGAASRTLAGTIPLPAGTEVIALPERDALGLERSGRPRPLGGGRWSVGAILPIGHLRLGLPAYTDDSRHPALRPRAYAAVGADANGELVVAAAVVEPSAVTADGRSAPDLAARMSAALRDRPSNRLVRQLARCAKEYRCRAATNAFVRRHDCALPVAAPTNEHPPAVLLLRDDADASPSEPAAFHPTATEIADVAVDHLESGGLVAFGRACEGEPLLAARAVEAAIIAIRERTRRGTVHLETNGSSPIALRRLCDAGLDSVAFRIASARAETYDALHRPEGYRFLDVRAAIGEAIGRKIAVAIVLLLLPGLSDRDAELDATLALAHELPDGSTLLLRDLAADPQRALALVPSAGEPAGMDRLLDRLRSDASHLRIATLPRPLVGV